jgi:hypothetical protein
MQHQFHELTLNLIQYNLGISINKKVPINWDFKKL